VAQIIFNIFALQISIARRVDMISLNTKLTAMIMIKLSRNPKAIKGTAFTKKTTNV